MDARAPFADIPNMPEAETSARTASEQLLEFSKLPRYRLRTLEEPDLVHFSASLAFGELGRKPQFVLTNKVRRLKMGGMGGREYLNLQPQMDDEFTAFIRAGFEGGGVAFSPEEDRDAEDQDQYELPAASKATIARAVKIAAETRKQALIESGGLVWSEDVAALLAPSIPGITVDEVRLMREQGLLLAVKDHDRNVYPLFQFERGTSLPFREIEVANEHLSENGSSWSALFWWTQPNPFLNGERPCESLLSGRETQREGVLNALYALRIVA
jgi:hypothetical protein